MSDAYQRVVVGRYDNGTNMVINKRTAAMLEVVEDRLGFNLTIVQGSYHDGSESVGTHLGGGVIDLRTWNLTVAQRNAALAEARRVGFIAWYRTKAQGFDEHMHWVARGDAQLHPSAAEQVKDALAGRNGLKSNLPDDDNLHVPTFNYDKYVQEKAAMAALEARVDALENLVEARTSATGEARAQAAYAAIVSGGSIDKRLDIVEGRVTGNTDARAQSAYETTHGGAVTQALAGLESRADGFSASIAALSTRVAGLESALAELNTKDAALQQQITALKAQVDALPKA